LWLRTDSILDRHWLATKMLASELGERGVVRRDRAQEILDRWMPVCAGSMLEALGHQQPVCQYVASTAEIPQ
jgi:1,2-phenylacetyl-CoA epoxidase catalytic subunit